MRVESVLPEVEMEAIRVHADPEALRAAFLAVAGRSFDLFFEKGGDYDIQLPYWHRHPFGDRSYGHELFKKAGRAVSIVLKALLGGSTRFEGLDEQIKDIINYAVMWLHWRNITGRSVEYAPCQSDALPPTKEYLERLAGRGTEVTGTPPPTVEARSTVLKRPQPPKEQ